MTLEHVFPVVRDPGTTVLPLGETYLLSIIELDPATLADGFAREWIVAIKPGNHTWSLGAVQSMIQAVVVRQGYIKRVEARSESSGGVVGPRCRIRVVVTTVVLFPLSVP